MVGLRITQFIGAVILTLVTLVSLGRPASAEEPVILELPAGIACDFALNIEILGGVQVNKEFTDKNGNVVRLLSAGKGSALTFINAETGATLAIKPDGSVSHTTINPDGTLTVSSTGHNVIILFPTDVPAGPSTIQYIGRVVYTIDPATGVFTVQKVSGKQTDICAALSE